MTHQAQSIDLIRFLQIAPGKAVKRCISLLNTYELIRWHANKNNSYLQDESKINVLLGEQWITEAVLSNADVEASTQIIGELLQNANR